MQLVSTFADVYFKDASAPLESNRYLGPHAWYIKENEIKQARKVKPVYLIPKTRRCRNQHSMAFQTPIANTDVYKSSFFPQTIRD